MKTPTSEKRVEKKSDDLDNRILAITAHDYKHQRIRTGLTGAMLVFIIVGTVITLYFLHQFSIQHDRITEDTKNAVTVQIPGLKKTIEARDKTIRQQNDVISQETDAILKLANQVKQLGGDPGTIEIRPKEE